MSAMASLDSESLEPRLLKAGVLALLVHVVFFIFMTFGLSWKTYPPEGVVVDLWSDLPQPAQLPTKKAKPLRSKPVQPPKKVKPLPPKIEKTPALTKPDITIKKEKIKKPKPVVKKQQTDKKQKARIAAEVERLQKQQLEEEERERLRKKAAGAQAAFKHQLIDDQIPLFQPARACTGSLTWSLKTSRKPLTWQIDAYTLLLCLQTNSWTFLNRDRMWTGAPTWWLLASA